MYSDSITTIKTALNWAGVLFQGQEIDYLREARLILTQVMQTTPEYIQMYPDKALTAQQTADFQNKIMRRSQGIPLAYVLGQQGFYSFVVDVNADVLIPRPETELLVEKALAWAKQRYAFVVDVGTGSGVIALALAKHLDHAQVTGIDISPAALKVAEQNAQKLGLKGQVRWLEGNLLDPIRLRKENANLIVANLPYIPTGELAELAVSHHEPHLALDGGADGLMLIRELLQVAPQTLLPDGLMLLEIGAGQGEAVKALAEAAFPTRSVTVEDDLAGHDRLVSIQ